MATATKTKEIKEARQNNVFCQSLEQLIGIHAWFPIDSERVLCRKASIHEAQQEAVPGTYRRAILYKGNYPILARHSRTRRMYDEARQKLYWPHMATDIYNYASNCESCSNHRPSQKYQRWMQVLAPSGPFEFVDFDIFKTFTKQMSGSLFVVMVTVRYRKLARAILTPRVAATLMVTVVLKHWIVPEGITNSMLVDSRPQVVSKIFTMVCVSLRTSLVLTTEYHLRVIRRVTSKWKSWTRRRSHHCDITTTISRTIKTSSISR